MKRGYLNRLLRWSVAGALVSIAGVATSHEPPGGLLLHLPFDGTLASRGSLPATAELITENGEMVSTSPDFREGRFGQSIYLSGKQAVRVPFDLSYEFYPQVTVTAWIYTEGEAHGYVVSNRSRQGPSLSVSKSGVSGRGPDAQPGESGILRPGRWLFIAGVWDTDAREMRLYYDRRSESAALSERVERGAMDIWIGAWDDSMLGDVENIRIDDVRVYDQALTAEQLEGLWLGEAPQISDSSSSGVGGASLVTTRPSAGEIQESFGSQSSIVESGGITGGTTALERSLEAGRAEAAASTPSNTETTGPATGMDSSASGDEIGSQAAVIGWTLSSSDFYETSLAGSDGEFTRPVETTHLGAMQRLGWKQVNGQACRVLVAGSDGSGAREVGTCGGITATRLAELPAGAYVTGLFAETSDARLQGGGTVVDSIVTTGRYIDDKGEPGLEVSDATADSDWGGTDSEANPEGHVECRDGYLATGVIAHFRRQPNDTTRVHGFKLVCRKIEKIYQ